MKLIYRGEMFDYNPRIIKPLRQPRAINWRYQLSGSLYKLESPCEKVVYRQPRVINWRYQLLLR